MDLDTFLATIRDSSPDEWIVLAGPYIESFRSTTDDLELYVHGHSYVAHYKPDLDISIAWGAEQNRGEPWGPGHGGWGEHFPDAKVYGVQVELRWGGAAVQHDLVCSVDGDRYYLPIMDGDEPEGGWGSRNPVSRWKVRPSALPLPKLLNGLVHNGHDFDEGLRRTGADIVDY